MIVFAFAIVSFLYATVGQAGGTAFLAVMTFSSFSPSEMRPTPLLLNIVAAAYSTWLFNRGSHIDWAKLKPFLPASIPTAFVGGFIVLNERIYDTLTGLVLILAALVPIVRRARHEQPDRPAPLWRAITIGAIVGLVSGLTGVGGGVFLAPILLGLHWASPKQTATLSAPFILANSVVSLMGALYAGQVPAHGTLLYALAALAGASIGALVGLRWLSQTMTRYVLAVILGAADVQLLFL
jgi:uncharacterized membrane protein YfcA